MTKNLYLIDGSNQAFRAFFAIKNDMRSPDGFPTRALFGFAAMLKKLLREKQPDLIAVVFDKGKTFRHEIYPEYKAQRAAMPDDLRKQWPEFGPFCEEMGVRSLAMVGFEADDIIGTLAVQGRDAGMDVYIVSSDKDFAQLVDDHIHLMDVRNDKTLGPAEVVEKWGVAPGQIVDLLALMGDKSDNIPGVAGVGPKKAAGFIQRFGTAAGAVEHAAEIGGKTGQTLSESADVVALSRELVTIVTNVELGLAVEDLAIGDGDLPALEKRLQRYNFRRMLADVRTQMGGGESSSIDRSIYKTIQTSEALGDLIGQLKAAGRFAFDSETTSLNPLEAKIVGLSFCWTPQDVVYVPIAHRDGQNCPDALARLAPILADPTIKKTGQNLKYDLKVLRVNGYDLQGIDGDTMLGDYLRYADQRHGLDNIVQRILGHEMIAYKDVTKDIEGDFSAVPIPKATEYAGEDAHVVLLLEKALELGVCNEGEGTNGLDKLHALYRDLEIPLIPILASMEMEGIGVDIAGLGVLSEDIGKRIQQLEDKIYAEAADPDDDTDDGKFNINSTKQLATILFDQRGLKPIKKTKTGRSTDAATLAKLAASGDKLSEYVMEYRELSKLKSTYIDRLPEHVAADGRIHTSFHQAGTVTGRLSSNAPNLQNIPIRSEEGRKIRHCFVARPGMRFLSADYSQIELRVLAHFCEQGPLVEAFLSGDDIHRRTASEVFNVIPGLVTSDMRRAAKAINFGIVYGMSAFRLSNELNISRKMAQAYMDDYFDRYPQVLQFMKSSVASAKKNAFAETLYGRRRPVYGLDNKNWNERMAAERIAINTPVQGTAADLIKKAMIKVFHRLGQEMPNARLLLQVHDELVLEVPTEDLENARRLVVEEMEGVDELRVPLVVETGDGNTWDEAH